MFLGEESEAGSGDKRRKKASFGWRKVKKNEKLFSKLIINTCFFIFDMVQ